MKLSLVIWLLKLLTRPVASDMTDLTWTRFLIQTLISAQYKMAQAMLTSIIIHNIVMRILQVVGGGGRKENGTQCNDVTLTDVISFVVVVDRTPNYCVKAKLQCRYRYLPRTTVPEILRK